MLSGLLYDPYDQELLALRKKARLLTEQYNRTSIEDLAQRTALIRQLFGSVADTVYIEPSFQCDYGCHIHVGKNFYANYNCVILDAATVTIGDNCLLAPQVGIYTATHPIDLENRKQNLEYAKPITIGDHCWIGGRAVINPGVTLGHNVIVASGAVVTKSFGNDVLIGGVPARVWKDITPRR